MSVVVEGVVKLRCYDEEADEGEFGEGGSALLVA